MFHKIAILAISLAAIAFGGLAHAAETNLVPCLVTGSEPRATCYYDTTHTPVTTGLLNSTTHSFTLPLSNLATGTSGYALTGNGASASTYQGFLQTLTGGTTRTWNAKAADTVNVQDFPGCDPTGATDSTACFQAAVNSFGTSGTGGKGGVVHFRGKYLLNSANLTIPPEVTLQGDCKLPGLNSNTVNDRGQWGTITCGVLMLSSTYTISVGGGSGVEDAVIYQAGTVFPTTGPSAFAGKAFTVAGDDAHFENILVMAFNYAIYSSGFQRLYAHRVYGDNVNGIYVVNSTDVARIIDCHMWPFSGNSNGYRSGTAFYIGAAADWTKLTDNFSWGYARGIDVLNANNVVLIGNSMDNDSTTAGTYGIVIEGTSEQTVMIGNQTAGQTTAGTYIGTSAGTTTTIIGQISWGSAQHGIWINDVGNVSIYGGKLTGTSYGITESNATSVIFVDGMTFNGNAGGAINASTATNNIIIGSNNNFQATPIVVGAGLTAASVASASAVTLPRYGSTFNITGTTTINTLDNGWFGRTVTLIFGSALTVHSATGASNDMWLSGAANWTTVTTGSTLTLRHNGTQWYEIGRSN